MYYFMCKRITYVIAVKYLWKGCSGHTQFILIVNTNLALINNIAIVYIHRGTELWHVCAHTCMHVCMTTCIRMYVHIYTYVCMCVCVYVHACMCACVRTCVCVTVYWEGRSDVIERWDNFIVNIHNLGNVQDMYM